MTPHYEAGPVRIFHGDCIDVMRELPDSSVDAIVTDPPYGLGFMGKDWDDLPPGLDFAIEAFRVLKPGGHILAFGGSRTWHRLAVAVEDAGFEIRDSIAWLYGSGFPKSMDVSAAVDKLDAADERRARALEFTAYMRSRGMTPAQIDAITGTNMGGHFTTAASQPSVATADLFDMLRPHLGEVPARIEELVAERTVESKNWAAREVNGEYSKPAAAQTWRANVLGGKVAPAREKRDRAHTDAAKAWEGWGTALKPAFEPIVVGRKPLQGTVAGNVLAYGVGALNIDATRVPAIDAEAYAKNSEPWTKWARSGSVLEESKGMHTPGRMAPVTDTSKGRWPANVVLDGHAADELDRQSGITASSARVGARSSSRAATQGASNGGTQGGYNLSSVDEARKDLGDSGGASRFFPTFRYEAKAPGSERPEADGIAHPTVKPLDLMRWLVRLVTPPGGTVLEPFAGSGTTAEACVLEGFGCIAIEREADYLPLIRKRIQKDHAVSLFGEDW